MIKGKKNKIEITVSNLCLDWSENREKTYYASFIKDSKNLSKLFKAINNHTGDFLNFEIGRLNGFMNGDKTKESYDKEKLASYHGVLKTLDKKLKESALNSAMICIGFGKSIFLNTILLAIKTNTHIDEELNYDTFTDLVKILYPSHPKAKFFPISNYTTTIESTDYPLGWLQITDINSDAFQVEYELPNFELVNLKPGDTIKGLLIERGSSSKVQVSIDGRTQTINANGLSKFERNNNVTLPLGILYSFEIVAIKEDIIKDIKFI